MTTSLVQFVISYDDLLNNSNANPNSITINPITATQTSWNNAATVLKQLNLYGGHYLARVDGFEVFSGAGSTTTFYINPQVININSSKFHFSANGNQGLSFTNNNNYCNSTIAGHRPFEINTANGNLELVITINQYGQNINSNPAAVAAPWTQDKTATWASAQFAYMILTLALEPFNDKLRFSDMKYLTQ
jgi:hypothetical protein